jgi:hypothetical protein
MRPSQQHREDRREADLQRAQVHTGLGPVDLPRRVVMLLDTLLARIEHLEARVDELEALNWERHA